MKITGLDVLDSTIQRTNAWLKELMQELNWTDRRKTYLALRSVLHTVRDHLPVETAVYFGEQLPILLRGVYFEHWDPEGKPLSLPSPDDLTLDETVIRAVFRLLDRKAADGEIEDLQHLLPGRLQDLWPQTLRAA